MGSRGPFTLEDLARWPAGVEKAEVYEGALFFRGRFREDDVEAAERVYPGYEVRLDDGGIWVLPPGESSISGHPSCVDEPCADVIPLVAAPRRGAGS